MKVIFSMALGLFDFIRFAFFPYGVVLLRGAIHSLLILFRLVAINFLLVLS